MSSFDGRVDRRGMSTIKQLYTPECVRKSDTLSLWGAEFEFPTAPFVVDAIAAWARQGLYGYAVLDEELRRQICDWMRQQRQWPILPEWIVPVYGITASLATAMRAFTNPGDGIIGMTPGYHMYWEAIELSGRTKVENRLLFDGTGYRIDWEDLEQKLANPNNRILAFCNPHNPIGKVFTREEICRLAALAKKHRVLIFNDEIFAECLYPGISLTTFGQVTDQETPIITATSLGKCFSFTGTNQANLIIPNESVRKRFLAERDREFYGSMNPMMIPAYRAAYTKEGAAWLKEMMDYVAGNYELVADYFAHRMEGFVAIRPQGTYILWVDAREFMKRRGLATEGELMDFLTNKAHFHVDAGEKYGGETGFFRMTLSVPRKDLKKALENLANLLS